MEKLISALIIVTFTVSVTAATIYIDANGTGDYPTIQAAINAAGDGDVIILQPGTYTGDGNKDIGFLGKAITVRSETGPENCIIDCNGTYDQNHRGFYFDNNEGAGSVLKGLTVKNAYIVVLCGGGAGIYIEDASPTIKDCILTNNNAQLSPGSLCYCYGGGIYIGNGGSPSITDCIISDNSVGNWGWGGGIYCGYETEAVITGCLIYNNTALGVDGAGGGIYCSYLSDSTIINCSIADNSAADEGGGSFVYAYGDSSGGTIANSIIWDNSPDQIYTLDIDSLIVRYSDIEGDWPGIGNIDTDPCFADADANDYHLKSQAGRWDPNSQIWVTDAVTSPCIDAGNPGCPPGAEPDPNGNRINMGAYGGTAQASKSPDNFRSLSDMDNNWVVDLNDLAIFAGYWLDSGICVPSDLDRSSAVDFKDYAVFTYDPCSGGAVGEPEIIYQIEDCDMGFITLDSDSNDLRFTVTVEGRYILFEDMMVANCCPDGLELQMAVDGNLITIQEIEYGGICLCICDYPVSATIGPFAPGTYTLEVYQDEYYGGFIGSTTVTIH